MSEKNEKKALNPLVANALFNLLLITVVDVFTKGARRHPDHDFYGYAYVKIGLNPAVGAALAGKLGATDPLAVLFAYAVQGLALGMTSVQIKRFRKSGAWQITSANVKTTNGWFPQVKSLTTEMYEVIKLVVLRDERVKASIAAIDLLPIPPKEEKEQNEQAAQSAPSAPVSGAALALEMPFA